MTLPLLRGPVASHDLRNSFAWSAALLLAALIVIVAWRVEYPDASITTDQHIAQYYLWFIHVAVMIYTGFGFLMTFLRSYSFSAVGLNYLYSSFIALTAIICVGAANQIFKPGGKSKIQLTMPLLIDSLFCAGAGMISFGAVLGKTSPVQTLWLLVLEVPIYAVNCRLAQGLGALDVGGSLTIHAFGAYYGLAATMVLSRQPGSGADHEKNRATKTSDMTAMIGSLFLNSAFRFIFWPSFVGALASDATNPHSPSQFLCVFNTVLALFGSCCATFITSAAVSGKLDMVLIQNSTLAGGVAIGSAANLHLSPAAALIIGVIAGLVSTEGYAFLQSSLESRFGLKDTCGVHNLHGLPGLLGGVVAGFAAMAHSNSGIRNFPSPGTQLWHQLLAAAVTFGMAVAGGSTVSTILRLLGSMNSSQLKVEDMFEDSVIWEEGSNEEEHILEEEA